MSLLPHEPTEECNNWHCYAHGVDEVRGAGASYMGCAECGHVYRTPRELRSEYRRVFWRMMVHDRSALRKVGLPGDEAFVDVGRWARLRCIWHSTFIRARDIIFCPLCTHDF